MSYQFGHIDRDERIDYSDERPPDDELPPRRHLGGAVLAVGVMALFAGGLWFAYHEGTKHATTSAAAPDQVPLIRADGDPVKVKPDRAGGMDEAVRRFADNVALAVEHAKAAEIQEMLRTVQ